MMAEEKQETEDAPNSRLTEADIERRVRFILQEARLLKCKRDQTVTFALRVVSNYVAVRRDASSPTVKRLSKYRSAAALRVCKGHWKDWHKKVTNEHQEPLAQVWEWLQANHATLSVQDVLTRLEQWPVVVITQEEAESLRRRGMDSLPPDERYRKARIKVMVLTDDGKWIARVK